MFITRRQLTLQLWDVELARTHSNMAAAAPAPVPAVVGTPSRLGSAPINLGALRDDAYGELVEILSRVPGKILLVVDPLLIAPLKLVVAEGSKALREFRVESLLELSPAAPSTAAFDSVLYLTRPAFPMVKAVAAHVRAMVKRWEAGREARKGVHLHFVPRRTFIAEQLLKDEMGGLGGRRHGCRCYSS